MKMSSANRGADEEELLRHGDGHSLKFLGGENAYFPWHHTAAGTTEQPAEVITAFINNKRYRHGLLRSSHGKTMRVTAIEI